jgi:hypothetical protein
MQLMSATEFCLLLKNTTQKRRFGPSKNNNNNLNQHILTMGFSRSPKI